MTADSIALLVIVVSIGVLLHWLPLWRRHSIWFGVTVDPGFSATPEARRILRQYRIEMWVLVLIGWAVAWMSFRGGAAWMLAAGPLLEAFGAFLAFARGRNRTRPYARHQANRSAPLIAQHESLPGGIAGIVLPYAVLAAAAIFLRVNWDRLPSRFPVHWGLEGTPDRWAERTWQAVYTPLIAGLLVIALMHVLGYMILAASPRARVAETTDWTARFRRANLRLIVALGWTLALLFAVLSLNPYLSPAGAMAIPTWVILVGVLGITVGFAWPLVRVCQEPGSGSDGTPDECWKLGQIYYNPNDPALMVEKRFGIGYTINFGNRASWLLVGLLLVIVLTPLILA